MLIQDMALWLPLNLTANDGLAVPLVVPDLTWIYVTGHHLNQALLAQPI